MKVEPINVAVVGCGVISDVYMRSLQDKFQITNLVACCDLDESRMQDKARQYGIRPMRFAQMLEDEQIDMIVNLTNPSAHFQISKQALEHGKHVFSEKMLAVELEGGKALCDLARAHRVRLGVAPDTFLGGGMQTARYVIEQGLIGTPLSVVASLNRNYEVFGDILPHLHKKGGNFPFDVGCYYMTALAAMLGPVSKVSAFARVYRPERVSRRVDKPWFGEPVIVEGENILTAALQFENGVLGTVHLNSESILDERPCLEIYGTEGILIAGDPNQFGVPVQVKKPLGEIINFPFTHGYTEDTRGLGAAEMAWSIRTNRAHRASMEMGYHVFELIHGMIRSARNGELYQMRSTFDLPAPLPAGYLDNGFWGPAEESALTF